jgi:hypothetical protein
MTLTPVVNYRALKGSLRDLPGFPALKATVRDFVNTAAPKDDPILAIVANVEPLHDFFAAAVAARRVAAKVEAWSVVANVLAADVLPKGLPDALVNAVLAFREEAGEPAVAAGAAAVSAADDALVATLPAINEEAF